jgi:hypothetical protein
VKEIRRSEPSCQRSRSVATDDGFGALHKSVGEAGLVVGCCVRGEDRTQGRLASVKQVMSCGRGS